MTVTTAYNNVNWSNVNNFTDMLTAMNTSGAGYLFVAINFLVFFVLFITLSVGFGWEASLLTSSFIALILSLLLNYAGVVAYKFVLMFLALLLFGIIYIVWSSRQN